MKREVNEWRINVESGNRFCKRLIDSASGNRFSHELRIELKKDTRAKCKRICQKKRR